MRISQSLQTRVIRECGECGVVRGKGLTVISLLLHRTAHYATSNSCWYCMNHDPTTAPTLLYYPVGAARGVVQSTENILLSLDSDKRRRRIHNLNSSSSTFAMQCKEEQNDRQKGTEEDFVTAYDQPNRFYLLLFFCTRDCFAFSSVAALDIFDILTFLRSTKITCIQDFEETWLECFCVLVISLLTLTCEQKQNLFSVCECSSMATVLIPLSCLWGCSLVLNGLMCYQLPGGPHMVLYPVKCYYKCLIFNHLVTLDDQYSPCYRLSSDSVLFWWTS